MCLSFDTSPFFSEQTLLLHIFQNKKHIPAILKISKFLFCITSDLHYLCALKSRF